MPTNWSVVALIIGAIACVVTAAYTRQTAIPVAPDLFTFLAGVFSAIFAQELLEDRREKRAKAKKMTDHIYGPLLNVLNSIREVVDEFEEPVDEHFEDSLDVTLQNLIKDYRFKLDKELELKVREFQQRLVTHTSLRREAFRETESCIGRTLSENKIDKEIKLSIWAAGSERVFSFIDPVFRGEAPLDFMVRKAKQYGDAFVVAYERGKSRGNLSSDQLLNRISLDIIQEVEKVPKVQAYRRDRQNLLETCTLLIDLTEKAILL